MRIDLNEIISWMKPGTRILDLACGDGTLLKILKETKDIEGYGLEIDAAKINACISKGVNVIEQNLDEGISNFTNKSFDTVVMTQALQEMRAPDTVLEEMLRVGKECIVTFPNFGHWMARVHLGLFGRMPVSDLLPFEWYNTPNIHFCTFKDFEVLCRAMNITILHRQVVAQRPVSRLFKDFLPNFFGETAIYHLTKNGS